jgi:hypothetical protein
VLARSENDAMEDLINGGGSSDMDYKGLTKVVGNRVVGVSHNSGSGYVCMTLV